MDEGWKIFTVGHCFSSIFDNSRKNTGQALLQFLLLGSTIAKIRPMCQARTCARVLSQGPTPSAPKQCKSDVHVKVKTLSARDRHWRNPNYYKECGNIKSWSVSALTGSVPCKMAKGLQRVSAPNGIRTTVARLSATRLNHWAIGSYHYTGKNTVYDSSYYLKCFATCNRFFACRIVVFR